MGDFFHQQVYLDLREGKQLHPSYKLCPGRPPVPVFQLGFWEQGELCCPPQEAFGSEKPSNFPY